MKHTSNASDFMQYALTLAKDAFKKGEVPVSALIVHKKTGKIIAQAHNQTIAHNNPTAHAEMLVLEMATKKLGQSYLQDYDLYVTLEPCPMCAAAISLCRVGRVYYGAYDPKSGGVDHGPHIYDHKTSHHKPEVYGGFMERASGDLLKLFFEEKRHT